MLLCSMSLYGQQTQLQTSVNQSSELLFIENKGQVFNENGKPATDVLFVMKQPDFSIFIYKDGLSYQFTKNIGSAPTQLPTAVHDLLEDFPLNEQLISTHRIDVKFQAANKNAVVTPMLKNSYTENYFGNADITNIASFQKILISNIYSGIDWVLYQVDGKLKYDLVVHPGANAQQIKMEIIAADETVLLKDDHLQIKTTLGEINDAGLYSYIKNTGVHIDSKFELKNNMLQFIIADYDASQTLIIDPSLDWSTYYGGFGEDAVNGMEVDLDGNILITGYTSSSNNMAALGYKNSYLGGFFDVYVAKLDNTGHRIWGTYFGGNKGDYGTEVAVNKMNEIYVTGFTFSANFETTPGAHQETLGNNYDAFLFKLTDEGNLMWSTLYGGGNYDYARGLAIDTAGNIYISGSTSSASAIASGGWQNTKSGSDDEFLAKFDRDGVRLWATYMGGESGDYSRAVGVDHNNNVYIVGYTESTTGIAYNGFDEIWSGNYDCTLTKYDENGLMIWSTYFGGNGEDNANGIAFDVYDNIYVAIQTGTNTGLALDGYRGTSGGGIDAMLAKFNPDGDRLWSTYYGGAGEDMAKAVAVNNEFVYLCGHTSSTSGIAQYGYQNSNGGIRDVLLTKFDVFGNFYWATYAGGFWDEYGRTIDIIDDEHIVYGGKSFSWDFPTTPGAHQKYYGGGPADGVVQHVYDCASAEVYYADLDGDGYGAAGTNVLSCNIIPGYVLNGDDCNDAVNTINPTAIDICNGIDDNCSGLIDENLVTANITALGVTTFCQGSSVVLQADYGVGYLYQWRKNGVDLIGATSQNYTANAAGAYTVVVSIAGGCAATSSSISVTVNKKPKPAITALGSLDICLTGSVNLKTANKVGSTYQWYKNGITIAGATSYLYTATAAGNYYVRETSAAGCVKNSTSVVVTSSCKIGADDNYLFTVSPNPANDFIIINFESAISENNAAELFIYNELGQEILHIQESMSNNALNKTIQLPAGIANGMYAIRIIVDGKTYQLPIIVQ